MPALAPQSAPGCAKASLRCCMSLPCARVAALQRKSHYGCRMTIGWRFIGEVWGTYKRPLVLECVVPIPNRKEAEAIAKQRLKGAELHHGDRAVSARKGRAGQLTILGREEAVPGAKRDGSRFLKKNLSCRSCRPR